MNHFSIDWVNGRTKNSFFVTVHCLCMYTYVYALCISNCIAWFLCCVIGCIMHIQCYVGRRGGVPRTEHVSVPAPVPKLTPNLIFRSCPEIKRRPRSSPTLKRSLDILKGLQASVLLPISSRFLILMMRGQGRVR